jgi:hypothetical protein
MLMQEFKQGFPHCLRGPLGRSPTLRVLGFPWARVYRVSRPSGVDRLLRPQPYSGGALSVWVVSGREPTRPSVVGLYGPPSGVAIAS